jgi:hypothetical protein
LIFKSARLEVLPTLLVRADELVEYGTLFAAVHESGSGTERRFKDVRSHVGSGGVRGNVANGTNSTLLTLSSHCGCGAAPASPPSRP